MVDNLSLQPKSKSQNAPKPPFKDGGAYGKDWPTKDRCDAEHITKLNMTNYALLVR